MTSLPVPTRKRKITKMTISLALTDRENTATMQAGRRKLDYLHIVISVQAISVQAIVYPFMGTGCMYLDR